MADVALDGEGLAAGLIAICRGGDDELIGELLAAGSLVSTSAAGWRSGYTRADADKLR